MTDFTLNEYDDIPEEKLVQILQKEARKMFNFDANGNHVEEGVNVGYLPSQQKHQKTELIFRYWERIKSFKRGR